MDLGLTGKVAVVTGASRGIGLAVARRLLDEGASVMLTSRSADGLAEAAAALIADPGVPGTAPGAPARLGDLAERVAVFAANAGVAEQAEACVSATVERFGHLDVLVNNAATNPYFGPMLDIDASRARKTMEVNQLALLWWTGAAWRAGMAERGGAICNIASVGGLGPEPGIGWYNATKAAAIHITRQLAYELAPAVRVNAVAPGLVTTRFARALWEGNEDRLSANVPLRRLGAPDDVAGAVAYLCSDAASWVTGHTLVVDGGTTISPSGGVG